MLTRPIGGSGQVGMMPLAGDMGGRGSETLPSVLRAPTLFAMAMKEEGALRLISLTADGNWSGTQSQQQVPALSFRDQHGVWKRSGRREITATVLDFDVDPSTGQLVEVVRVRYIVTFSRNLQEVASEYVGEAFSVDQDPLDPDEIPGRSFENTFTGRRVTVEME